MSFAAKFHFLASSDQRHTPDLWSNPTTKSFYTVIRYFRGRKRALSDEAAQYRTTGGEVRDTESWIQASKAIASLYKGLATQILLIVMLSLQLERSHVPLKAEQTV